MTTNAALSASASRTDERNVAAEPFKTLRIGVLLESHWLQALQTAARQARSALALVELSPTRVLELTRTSDLACVIVQAERFDGDLPAVARLLSARDGRPCLVMVRPDADRAAILRDLRAGVAEVVTRPAELRGVIASLAGRARDDARGHGTAELRAILGGSAAIERVRREILTFADTSFRSVLVRGESGVGKELVARALWSCSAWRRGPFLAIAAPAIPDDHLEAELFGTEVGSFTGATRRAGVVERANGGVLFLDEIAAMNPTHQPKILRFLDDGVSRRLGSPQTYQVELGMVFATHEDLARGIQEQRFRGDLFHRLSSDGAITVPPLRDRLDDVPILARAFLREPTPRELSKSAEAVLCDFSWPGNVRQLRSVLRAALRQTRCEVIDSATVLQAMREICLEPRGRPERSQASFTNAANETRREILVDALRHAGGNLTEAGILLGFHRTRDGAARSPSDRRARKSAQRRFEYWWNRVVDAADP